MTGPRFVKRKARPKCCTRQYVSRSHITRPKLANRKCGRRKRHITRPKLANGSVARESAFRESPYDAA